MQYERYLKEVVNILEEDEGFKKKLEESNITDIQVYILCSCKFSPCRCCITCQHVSRYLFNKYLYFIKFCSYDDHVQQVSKHHCEIVATGMFSSFSLKRSLSVGGIFISSIIQCHLFSTDKIFLRLIYSKWSQTGFMLRPPFIASHLLLWW